MTNLATNLIHSAGSFGDRPILRLGAASVTYAELDAASARVAAMLRARGLAPGDRIGIMLPNLTTFPALYYGALRAGGVVVPMNPLLKAREVTHYLTDSSTELLFAFDGTAGEATRGAADAGTECILVTPGEFEATLADFEPDPRLASRDAADTAVILYTSGTTGQPKGAELTHANLTHNVTAAVDLFDLSEADVIFGGLPLFHSFGQTCALNAAVAAGACLTLLPRFDADATLETLEQHGVTIFEGVPTMYSALLNHRRRSEYDLEQLRLCVSGGAPLPLEVLREFEDTFGCVILEGYGLSETSPIASFNHRNRARKPGSIGTPIAGVEFRLVCEDPNGHVTDAPDGQIGEIAIRGHNVMNGYWNNPLATREAVRDGWFHTGDLARRDEDGYYFIVDRKKDLIIRGGFNVYPREIEEVLHEHPDVAAVAVIGVPHPTHGEEVAAAIQTKPHADLTETELRAFIRERVAAYKYPRHIWFVDALPMGPTGKILKREIVVPQS